MRVYQHRDADTCHRYGRSIRVKVNVAEVLRAELARPSWKRESVAVGAATDPYQPAEGRYRLTRSCIEELGTARRRALPQGARPGLARASAREGVSPPS